MQKWKILKINKTPEAAFELILWIIYVCLFKYAYYLEFTQVSNPERQNFPHPQIILYSVFTTLYLIPFYKLIIPYFLQRKKYIMLFSISILYLGVATKGSFLAVDSLFYHFNSDPELHNFYSQRVADSLLRSRNIFGWDLRILVMDAIAFSCVAFARYAFKNEARKNELEKENLMLQLNMLKSQLQPHFLFNSLNSIYSLSLTNSKETNRFILLLSEMMRYILYDCNKEFINLKEEIAFIENYFEMEQKKYPKAQIKLEIGAISQDVSIPPLLLLPLIENGFKHGAHHLYDDASVNATLTLTNGKLEFFIENDILNHNFTEKQGGVGLLNIDKRLRLYYPNRHLLQSSKNHMSYTCKLVLSLN